MKCVIIWVISFWTPSHNQHHRCFNDHFPGNPGLASSLQISSFNCSATKPCRKLVQVIYRPHTLSVIRSAVSKQWRPGKQKQMCVHYSTVQLTNTTQHTSMEQLHESKSYLEVKCFITVEDQNKSTKLVAKCLHRLSFTSSSGSCAHTNTTVHKTNCYLNTNVWTVYNANNSNHSKYSHPHFHSLAGSHVATV